MKQFPLTRAALGAGGRAKNKFPSVISLRPSFTTGKAKAWQKRVLDTKGG
jgi:hypothetical protein